jgi:hypothetical protein
MTLAHKQFGLHVGVYTNKSGVLSIAPTRFGAFRGQKNRRFPDGCKSDK